jgi:hypothetical protein
MDVSLAAAIPMGKSKINNLARCMMRLTITQIDYLIVSL